MSDNTLMFILYGVFNFGWDATSQAIRDGRPVGDTLLTFAAFFIVFAAPLYVIYVLGQRQ